jgi:hypothetical protein
VSVGAPLSEVPSITVDNGVGVARLVEHLIQTHGARNIACIRGPKANAEVEARVAAYANALQKHGIPVVERWIVEGNFTSESGRSAVAQLARLPGFKLTDLDAIVANNDSMAIGAMTELSARGVSVPEQVAVVGFDDLADAQLVQPPLASVAQPLEKIGQQAARAILSYVRHGGAPAGETLDTEVVLRRSCGCADVFAPRRSSYAPPAEHSVEVSTMMRRQRILLELTRSSKGGLGAAGSGWEQALFNAFIETTAAPLAADCTFMHEFQVVAERVAGGGGDLTLLDQVLETLRQQVVPLLRNDTERRERADDLFHMARGALSSMQQRRLTRKQLSLDRWNHTLALVCNEVSGAYGYDRLRTELRRHLPTLGVKSCFVAVYPAGGATDDALLITAFDAEVAASEFEKQSFRAPDLLPPGLARLGKGATSYSVHPLVWDGHRLGHILVELDTDTLFLSAALCGAVASALRGTQLIESLAVPPRRAD